MIIVYPGGSCKVDMTLEDALKQAYRHSIQINKGPNMILHEVLIERHTIPGSDNALDKYRLAGVWRKGAAYWYKVAFVTAEATMKEFDFYYRIVTTFTDDDAKQYEHDCKNFGQTDTKDPT